jgi:hypothetical protein
MTKTNEKNLQFKQTNRMSKQLIVENFLFQSISTINGVFYWRCQEIKFQLQFE